MNLIKPKVLILDIETFPIEAYVWDLKDQNIGLSQVKKDWSMAAWAAKWLDDPATKIMYFDTRESKDVRDDRTLLKPMWDLLNQADIVITQNGKNFDGPKINARFIAHGIKPPSPYRHLDTYQIVKHAAKFTSNKLEYLTDKLNVKYKKLSHSDFPGMSLWVECLASNPKAWEAMKRYNIHDVLSTEELYNVIKAWAPENAPKLYNVDQTTPECRVCGEARTQRRGFAWKKKTKVQRIQCMSCGTWDSINVPKEKKNAA